MPANAHDDALHAAHEAPANTDDGTNPAAPEDDGLLPLLALLLDASVSTLDLCRQLALTPAELAAVLNEPGLLAQLDALRALETLRSELIARDARPAALATLARAMDANTTHTQRLAAGQLLRTAATLAKPTHRTAAPPHEHHTDHGQRAEPEAPAPGPWTPATPDAAEATTTSPTAPLPLSSSPTSTLSTHAGTTRSISAPHTPLQERTPAPPLRAAAA